MPSLDKNVVPQATPEGFAPGDKDVVIGKGKVSKTRRTSFCNSLNVLFGPTSTHAPTYCFTLALRNTSITLAITTSDSSLPP